MLKGVGSELGVALLLGLVWPQPLEMAANHIHRDRKSLSEPPLQFANQQSFPERVQRFSLDPAEFPHKTWNEQANHKTGMRQGTRNFLFQTYLEIFRVSKVISINQSNIPVRLGVGWIIYYFAILQSSEILRIFQRKNSLTFSHTWVWSHLDIKIQLSSHPIKSWLVNRSSHSHALNNVVYSNQPKKTCCVSICKSQTFMPHNHNLREYV